MLNQQPVIDFRTHADRLFSSVFYKVREAKARFVVVFGSSNSSKSYSVHQSELLNIMQKGKGDTMILRKHGVDIRESSFKLLMTLISDWGISRYFKTYYSNENRRIVYVPTGRSIIFKGLDDSERIKSITGIKRVVMEEASEFQFDDFTELTRRARGYDDIQFILILNPISEAHWIKKQLCEPAGAYYSRTETLKFTYKDNKFAKPEDIDALEMLKNVSENQYKIYALGEWGIENKQGKFAWAFERSKHVRKGVEYNPEHLLWLTFDFNVNPMTCTCIQHYDEKVRAIKCIKLENSNIWEMLKHIQSYYPDALFKVTGDATGHNRSGLSKDNLHYYQVIQSELSLMAPQIQVPNVNPSIEENQLLVNAILLNYQVEIDEDNCPQLIYDLEYVEMNERKEIIKDRKSTKKYADFLDNFRYFLNVEFQGYLRMKA